MFLSSLLQWKRTFSLALIRANVGQLYKRFFVEIAAEVNSMGVLHYKTREF
jgi:hypothetical protein